MAYPAPLADAGFPAFADRARDGELHYLGGSFSGEIVRKIALHAFLPRPDPRPSPPLVQHDAMWQSRQAGALSCPPEAREARLAPQRPKEGLTDRRSDIYLAD